ncbi:MAG TPA: hypothetical protein VIY54_06190 [Steroidobacteraceae bacterium]
MAPVLYPPARPQTIGEVLDGGFRIFRATLLRCLPYGLLAMLSSQASSVYTLIVHGPGRGAGRDDPVAWLMFAVGSFLGAVFYNAIILRQGAIATGVLRRAQPGLRSAVRRAPATLCVIIVMTLMTGVWFAPLLAVARPRRLWAILVLGVPASYVGVAVSCALFALLIGGRGMYASLKYSVHLMRGNWWRAATIYAVEIAMLGVFYTLAGVLAAVILPFAGHGDLAAITAVSTVMAAVLVAVGVPFYSAMGLALYGDLEARRDGADLARRLAAATP